MEGYFTALGIRVDHHLALKAVHQQQILLLDPPNEIMGA
jgi:hypothetical protein